MPECLLQRHSSTEQRKQEILLSDCGQIKEKNGPGWIAIGGWGVKKWAECEVVDYS